MSRVRRSAWNLTTGFVFTALTMTAGFFLTPWILKWLGSERYGTYRALADSIGYLTLFDLGVLGAVTARLAPKVGVADEEGVSTVLTAGFRLYLYLAIFMLTGGLLLAIGLPYIMRFQSVAAGEARTAACILLIPVAWVPLSVFRALIESRQQAYQINVLMTMQSLLTTALLAFTAWRGWGLIGQAWATSLATIPLATVLLHYGLKHYSRTLFLRPDPAATRDLRTLNWPTFWFNISGRLGLLSDNIVIAWILGPSLVAPFYLAQRLAQIAQTQLQGIGNATWAGLVQLHAQGQTDKFCARLTELTVIVSGLGIAGMATIAAYNRHFMALWIGPSSYPGDWVTILSCSNIWMWGITSLWGWPISGAGHITEWVPFATWFALINIAVSVAATYLIGLPGPLLGTCVAFLVVQSWGLPHVLAKVFHPSLRSIWMNVVFQLIWGAPYAVVLWWIANSHRPRGWLGLGAEICLAFAAGLCLWWMSLNSSLRGDLRERLGAIFL